MSIENSRGGGSGCMKYCPKCRQTKSFAEFHLRRSGPQAGQPTSYCKPRRVTESIAWAKAHREANRAKARRWWRKQRERREPGGKAEKAE